MKRILLAAFLLSIAPAWAADVGISISVGQPGFYGRIDIGDVRPEVIFPEPVIIEHVPVEREPIYVRVRPGDERHWESHCHEYHACDRPVYFVRDRWYNDVYVPRYREHERMRREHERGYEERDHEHEHERGYERHERDEGHGDRDRDGD